MQGHRNICATLLVFDQAGIIEIIYSVYKLYNDSACAFNLRTSLTDNEISQRHKIPLFDVTVLMIYRNQIMCSYQVILNRMNYPIACEVLSTAP